MSLFKHTTPAARQGTTTGFDRARGIEHIRRAYPSFSPHTDRSVALFLTHHLDVLEPEELTRLTGDAEPSAEALLDALVFKAERKGAKGTRVLDYTLRGGVTDAVLSLHYGEDGEVDFIEMDG